jgi:hypothetical protein
MSAKRILLVDDEDDIREVAGMSLEAVGGHEVLFASSGAEAVATATAERPDAILLDVMMPGMDGPHDVPQAAGGRAYAGDPGHPAHGEGAGRRPPRLRGARRGGGPHQTV